MNTYDRTPAYIKHLSYDLNRKLPQATKQGWYVYDGNALDFPIGEFKIRMRAKCFDEKDEPGTRKSICERIDSLRGNALSIARTIGTDKLLEEKGARIEALRLKIRDHVYPIVKDELKALFQEGHRRGNGPLSQQAREPIQSYLERRERWLEMLKSFDIDGMLKSDCITKSMQGDSALDNALISDIERKLILTVTKNSINYDEIKACMLVHQKHNHLRGKGAGKARR